MINKTVSKGKSILKIDFQISSDAEADEIFNSIEEELDSGAKHIVLFFAFICYPYLPYVSLCIRCSSMVKSRNAEFTVIAFKTEFIDVLLETRSERLFNVFRTEQEMESVYSIKEPS
jgi:hypothetical protein